MEHSFEHIMREAFPTVASERVIRQHVAATAVFAFYILHTPGVHADLRKETFAVENLPPQSTRSSHRYSCKE